MTIEAKTKATASANPALKMFPFFSVLIFFLAPPNAAG
jgi:hypothetical protein